MKDIAVRTAIKPARGRPRAGRCRAWRWLAPLVAMISLGACGRDLPNPVIRQDGVTIIPMVGRTFVVPDKTWLKGYYRRSTDGLVAGFSLHAVAPNVEPWSPERNHGMYRVPGWGNRIEIDVSRVDQEPLWTLENWERPTSGCKFVPSTLFAPREVVQCESFSRRLYMDVAGGRVNLFITCDSDAYKKKIAESGFATSPYCSINYRYAEHIYVRMVFSERYVGSAFDITESVNRNLKRFESNPLEIKPQSEISK